MVQPKIFLQVLVVVALVVTAVVFYATASTQTNLSENKRNHAGMAGHLVTNIHYVLHQEDPQYLDAVTFELLPGNQEFSGVMIQLVPDGESFQCSRMGGLEWRCDVDQAISVLDSYNFDVITW